MWKDPFERAAPVTEQKEELTCPVLDTPGDTSPKNKNKMFGIIDERLFFGILAGIILGIIIAEETR